MHKTNALRILDSKNIQYDVREYDDAVTDGCSVAQMLNQPVNLVFKTLLTQADTLVYLVFMVPVDKNLNLKKAAKESGVKSVAMIKQKQLLPLTGYIHGGCCPVGMKKQFRTFIDISAKTLDRFFISAGKVGIQMKLAPAQLAAYVGAAFCPLAAEAEDAR